ncbi:hypothetical protein FRB99_005663 [Tulasnella sp. 403]|nr:hypothetical protein FRB99_005663 [Tulasnella sp. 403]
MDHTNIYLNQTPSTWPDQLLTNGAAQTSQSSVATQPTQFITQQRTANFTGTLPTASASTPYQQQSVVPQSSNATPTTAITPNAAYSYYSLALNGNANTPNTTNGSSLPANSFYPQYVPYFYSTGTIPISQYSSLSGATGSGNTQTQTASNNSTPTPSIQSTPQITQTHAPQPQVQAIQQHQGQHVTNPIVTAQQPQASQPARTNSSPMTIDWNDIDRPTRVEILTKIRDNAGTGFYKVWAKSPGAMEVLKDWLKATLAKKDGFEETLMPLLFIIDRLPLGVEELTSSKIAKVLVKVVKDPPSGAVKDLASNIETKWRRMVQEAGDTKIKTEDDGRSKKRKVDPSPPKTAPPAKKTAVAVSSTTSKPTTTIVKKVVQPVKDTKTDSSFFSSKPKPKLPSFRKTVAADSVKKEGPGAATAQPSSIDPFQEAMKLMGKPVGSPSPAEAAAAAIANSIRESTPLVVAVPLGKNGKPKKRVQFPGDDKLVQIKYIERAVYDDDNTEGAHHASYRDLDRDEGHALHAHLFEEQLDWYEPAGIEFPIDVLENTKRGTESTEIATQEEREKSALMAVYMSNAHIPDTPSDLHPGLDAPPNESAMVTMHPGAEVASLEAPIVPPQQPSLHDLLAKIAGSAGGVPTNIPQQPSGAFGGNNFANHNQPQDSEMSWNSGNPPSEPYSQSAGSSQNWNGQGLPPPTGNNYSDEWEGEGPEWLPCPAPSLTTSPRPIVSLAARNRQLNFANRMLEKPKVPQAFLEEQLRTRRSPAPMAPKRMLYLLLGAVVAGTIFQTLFITIPTISALMSTEPTVDISRILTHLRILDRIVDYHNGTRHAGSSGYKASAGYIENVLKKQGACDSIEKQYFKVPTWSQLSPPRATLHFEDKSRRTPPTVELKEGADYSLVHGPSASFSNASVVWLYGYGCPWVKERSLPLDVSAKVVVIARPSLAYSNGRTARDCSVNDVTLHAHRRGAVALVLANGFNDTQLWPLRGILDVPWTNGTAALPRIPVVSVSWVTGQVLQQHSKLSLTSKTSIELAETFNLLCVWDAADSTSSVPETLLIGAHLDSVPTGPGIVDNGSGLATILEWLVALQKAGWNPDGTRSGRSRLKNSFGSNTELPKERRVVWAWWGAEELGLLGSQYYVNSLKEKNENIVASINVDMIASPNGIPTVINATSAPREDVIGPSLKIQCHLQSGFRKLSEAYELANTAMYNSDEWSFLERGIPAGAIQSGASRIKTEAQRESFGGMAGAPMDPCYHSLCDTLGNVNVGLLKLMSRVGFRTVTYLMMKPNLKDWLWDGRQN